MAVAAGRAGVILLGLLLAEGPLTSQTVSSVEGEMVTISRGSRAGLRRGMTGLLCTMEEVGGTRAEICPAKVRLMTVGESSAQAVVVKGDARAIEPGCSFKAVTTGLNEPPAAADAWLVDEALRSFEEGDADTARDLLKRFLRRYPGHARTGFASRMLARLALTPVALGEPASATRTIRGPGAGPVPLGAAASSTRPLRDLSTSPGG